MPVHALLGATGRVGSSILRYLLANPPGDLTLKILVRSKSKLLTAFPDLESTAGIRVFITEGTSTEVPALRECLQDASLIYMCIASTSGGGPGTSLVTDTAAAVIDTLRDADNKTPPVILQLRSATLNPVLARGSPVFVRYIVHWCLKYTYDDLDGAAKLYDSQPKELLRVVYMDPPALHDPTGTERTGYKLVLESKEGQGDILSFADLGEAMVEVGEKSDMYIGKGVGAIATGDVNQTWGILFWNLFYGARTRILGF